MFTRIKNFVSRFFKNFIKKWIIDKDPKDSKENNGRRNPLPKYDFIKIK